mmetsp:Transcript_8020/g.26400  ORF Transcript_8020/g.26400 Transcript_8020/m.26400 type:complete len:320 (+) Transcript_8020:74-1033(+)
MLTMPPSKRPLYSISSVGTPASVRTRATWDATPCSAANGACRSACVAGGFFTVSMSAAIRLEQSAAMAAGDKSLKNPLNTSSVTSNSSEASTSAAARPLSCTTRSSSTWPSLTRTRCIFRTVTANSSHATRVASSASRAFSTSNFILRSSCSSCIRTEATPEVERTGLRDPARADIIDTSLDSSCSSWRAMTRQSRSATPRCSTGRRMRCRATLWSPSLPGLNTWRSAHNTAWRVFFDVMSSGTHNRTAKSWCMQLSRIASTQGSAPSSCNKLGSGASPSLAKASAPGLHGINTSRTTSSAVMSAVARRGSPQVTHAAL